MTAMPTNTAFTQPDAGDLAALIPAAFEHPDYCDANRYEDWERDVATPALQTLGFTVGRWRDGERDSFGPLTRLVPLSRDGHTGLYVYG
ncbi:hypothetical protein [Rubrimonas cliftonensis]|uniref:Uncharacterized protein n=1 Tax=Rubrimonas cliftonensis TaxID=89524 RepID=A0A1H4EUC5_9RHOB|nr:hypothetical protein [Rubrimonas cliftonensis]SEA87842.1 hypothetical protein SAMN05444370_11573 [Rubrimonas cliftonensis]